MNTTAAVVSGVLLLGMGGCGYGEWAANFRPNPAAPASTSAKLSESPQIRVCTPEQMEQAAAAEAKYLDEHKLAREDERLEDQHRIQAQQFPILRVRDAADSAVLLGESVFSDGEPASDSDPKLLHFARDKGASFVIFCAVPGPQVEGYQVKTSGTAWTGYGAQWGPSQSREWKNVALFYRRR